MARDYNLDTQAAKEANTGGKRITETGKYAGTITAAFYEQNQRGTESVNIMFASDNGQEVGPISLYTHNGSGEPLAGYKTLNALMTCCKVKQLEWKQSSIDLYDYDQQKVVSKQKECAANLKGAKIGLVLQQEEYQKQSGDVGERMALFAPYEHGTERMAAEILGKQQQATSLGGVMAFLAKNPVRRLKNSNGQAQQSRPAQQAPQSHDDYDDDIPF